MLILDTDHVSEVFRATPGGRGLAAKLAAAPDPVATTIITVEEQLRGRLAQLGRSKDADRLVVAYSNLQKTIVGFASWIVVPWNAPANETFARLALLRLGLGTMDLRIASIVLATDGVLLSRNMRDFCRVPELRVEDWLQ
jgi:tRNA(fMet)-specific endonuclease VapC